MSYCHSFAKGSGASKFGACQSGAIGSWATRFRAIRLLFVLLGLITIALSNSQSAWAKVKLSPLFVDGGIIQRDKPVNVFGTARQGEIVTCEIGGNKSVQIVKASGNFLVTLPPPLGKGPFTLRVAGDNLVEIKNLTPGEVWLVAGDGDLDRDLLSTGALPNNDDLPDSLQLFKERVRFAARPIRMAEGHWIKATDAGALAFSALGLKFGCNLAKQVGGPIAIIQVSCPETPIRSWISPGGLLSNSDTSGAPAKSPLEPKDYDKLTKDYQQRLEKWQASLTEGKEPTHPPLPSPLMRNAAGSLFNGMVAPLTPYSVRGAVWYHGRSDLQDVLNYKTFLSVWMKDLRQVFRQEGLPIILVQAGAIAEAQTGDDSPVSILRQVQYRARVAPRTYLAVSLDLDQKDKNSGVIKTDFDSLAQRITNIALSTQYHTPAQVSSPVIDIVEKIGDGEALKLQLRYADKGLQYSGKGEIKGFTISAWNHQYFDAQAQLDGDTIVVQSKFVKEPKFVRYCWGNSPTINLFSKNGLPLVPYTSDR
jgi:sialate O-acetylesterase